MSSKSREEVWDEWSRLVNMSPKEIEAFLDTEESKSVGDDDDTGRHSARRIVDISRTARDDLTDGQWDHMRKVVGYIKRHCAQVPKDPGSSDWRWSLMNWGHDPMKDDGCA